MKLDRVTITGADNTTNIDSLVELSGRFPFVEWGILLSKSSEGRYRFPDHGWVLRAHEALGTGRLSGHLCGAWVWHLLRGDLLFLRDRPYYARLFNRLQLNFHARRADVALTRFADALETLGPSEFIFQMDEVNNELLAYARAQGIRAAPQDEAVRAAALRSPRSIEHRARRAQGSLFGSAQA